MWGKSLYLPLDFANTALNNSLFLKKQTSIQCTWCLSSHQPDPLDCVLPTNPARNEVMGAWLGSWGWGASLAGLSVGSSFPAVLPGLP